jgi:hypothetical protein
VEPELRSLAPLRIVDAICLPAAREGAAQETFFVVHQAMAALERTLGPRGGIYTYTGQATADEIWERADDV